MVSGSGATLKERDGGGRRKIQGILSGVLLPFGGYCNMGVNNWFGKDGALRQELDSQHVFCVPLFFSGSDPFPVRITITINIII